MAERAKCYVKMDWMSDLSFSRAQWFIKYVMNATPSYKRVHILVPRNISCHSGYTLWLQPVKYKKRPLKNWLLVQHLPAALQPTGGGCGPAAKAGTRWQEVWGQPGEGRCRHLGDTAACRQPPSLHLGSTWGKWGELEWEGEKKYPKWGWAQRRGQYSCFPLRRLFNHFFSLFLSILISNWNHVNWQ